MMAMLFAQLFPSPYGDLLFLIQDDREDQEGAWSFRPLTGISCF